MFPGSERACSPTETVARMLPKLSGFGITRVAQQTGLDRIGMPCFSAIRPNSFTLATSQGKGLTDDHARASAIMEAIEYAVAERPNVESFLSSAAAIEQTGEAWFDPSPFLPASKSFDRSRTISWYRGQHLHTRRPIAVPADIVMLNGNARDLKGVCQTTNGLASGNNEDEAVFHALCELIERDANTLWLLRSDGFRQNSAIDAAALDDPHVDDLVSKITKAGLEFRLFDQTSVPGVPVFMALIGERSGSRRKFELAAGYGAHCSPAGAAIRAITEAAQTRITSIVGARDDIDPGSHEEPLNDLAEQLLQAEPRSDIAYCEPISGGGASDFLGQLINRMQDANLAEPIVVRLTESADFSVVRVISSDLEDYEANLNWRPGSRAMAMTVPS